jgi:hypothetical protein
LERAAISFNERVQIKKIPTHQSFSEEEIAAALTNQEDPHGARHDALKLLKSIAAAEVMSQATMTTFVHLD